jgi:hypothetical protein
MLNITYPLSKNRSYGLVKDETDDLQKLAWTIKLRHQISRSYPLYAWEPCKWRIYFLWTAAGTINWNDKLPILISSPSNLDGTVCTLGTYSMLRRNQTRTQTFVNMLAVWPLCWDLSRKTSTWVSGGKESLLDPSSVQSDVPASALLLHSICISRI